MFEEREEKIEAKNVRTCNANGRCLIECSTATDIPAHGIHFSHTSWIFSLFFDVHTINVRREREGGRGRERT